MDYFSQLLGSYDKLKKRKFRIIYEQGSSVEVLAQNLISQARNNTNQIPIPGKSGWVRMTQGPKNQGNINFFHPGTNKQSAIVGPAGIIPDTYAEFLRYLGSGEEGNSMGAAPEEEDPLGGAPVLPTNPLEQFMPPEWTEKTRDNFAKIKDELDAMCDKLRDPILCTSIDSYIGGAESKSLTSKFLNSITVLRKADTGERLGTLEDPIDPGLVEDLTGSLLDFIKLVAKPDDLKCDTLNSRISFNGDRMTLLSRSGEEGISIPSGDRLLKQLKGLIPEKACKNASFKNAFFNRRKGKSNLFGSFNESLVEFSMALVLSNGNERALFIAKKRMVEAIEASSAELDEVLQDYKANKDKTYSIEAYTEVLDNLELAGIIKTDSLRKHIGSRILMIKELFAEFLPDDQAAGHYLPVGSLKRTGSRADGLFLLKDEKQAKKLAKYLTGQEPIRTTVADLAAEYGSDFKSLATDYGLDVTSKGTIYVVRLGTKGYDNSPKLGEINSYARMQSLLTGDVSIEDPFLKAGFLNKINHTLDIKPDVFNEYVNSVMTKAEDKVNFVLDGAAFRNNKGALQSMKQEEIISFIRTKLTKELGYKQRLESALAGLLGPKGTELDLSIPENAERLSELIKRNTLLDTLSRDLAGKDKNTSTLAKQTILKMLYISGGDAEPLGQLTVTDSGVNVFQHGMVMNYLIKDINSGEGRIAIDGTNATIKFSTKKGAELSLALEATWSGKKREGRFVAKCHTKGIKRTNLKESSKATLELYLAGQKLLLDELFKSINAY